MDELLDIGEVAARSGMAASTLRYYEREGIIASAERKGLRRQYWPGVLETLAVVAVCQRASFSLTEIKALLATGGDRSWKVIAARKRDELRDQVRHLEMLADHLDHALECSSPNVFDCEHFQSALRHILPPSRSDGQVIVSLDPEMVRLEREHPAHRVWRDPTELGDAYPRRRNRPPARGGQPR